MLDQMVSTVKYSRGKISAVLSLKPKTVARGEWPTPAFCVVCTISKSPTPHKPPIAGNLSDGSVPLDAHILCYIAWM